MIIVNPSAFIIAAPDGMDLLTQIEAAGRTCYKSEDKITDESCIKFVKNVLARGHEAVIEHGAITARFICDRGVSHEIVRHRLAAYCQESTRYCNYGQEKHGGQVTFVKPSFWDEGDVEYGLWLGACQCAEKYYLDMLARGATPQQARSVLPNSVKTEVVMTANPREWRHFFKMRTPETAHPDMRVVANQLLAEFQQRFSVLFDDLPVYQL